MDKKTWRPLTTEDITVVSRKLNNRASATFQEVPQCKEMGLICVRYGPDLAQVKSISRLRFPAGVPVCCNHTDTATLLVTLLQLPGPKAVPDWWHYREKIQKHHTDLCMSCAAVILFKSQAIFFYSAEKNSSIQSFAIIALRALVNTSIYYRLLWQLVSRVLGTKKPQNNPHK